MIVFDSLNSYKQFLKIKKILKGIQDKKQVTSQSCLLDKESNRLKIINLF